jgi:predicted ester cyclase
MSNKLDVVSAYLKLLEVMADNAEDAWAYLADDFKNVDKDGKAVLNRERFIGTSCMLIASFPDISFVLTEIREEDDYVVVNGHNEGTHMNDIDLSAMGVGVVSATGKKIVWPEASFTVTVADDKISTWGPYGDYGGAAAWLSALGVKRPSE